MAKSKETFSKKEKEKKRAKKQQEKKEKKAQRQSNSVNGNNLDEMMAYVDENGNLTSSPPDGTKRREYSLEDIQIGIPKREDVPQDSTRTGVVTMFNAQKGYGFIKDTTTNESFFVHINDAGYLIKELDKVAFETEMGDKGKKAVNVKLQ